MMALLDTRWLQVASFVINGEWYWYISADFSSFSVDDVVGGWANNLCQTLYCISVDSRNNSAFGQSRPEGTEFRPIVRQ